MIKTHQIIIDRDIHNHINKFITDNNITKLIDIKYGFSSSDEMGVSSSALIIYEVE